MTIYLNIHDIVYRYNKASYSKTFHTSRQWQRWCIGYGSNGQQALLVGYYSYLLLFREEPKYIMYFIMSVIFCDVEHKISQTRMVCWSRIRSLLRALGYHRKACLPAGYVCSMRQKQTRAISYRIQLLWSFENNGQTRKKFAIGPLFSTLLNDVSANEPIMRDMTYVTCALVGLDRSHPESKVLGANMGPIWGRHDPGGQHVDPMNFIEWVVERGVIWHARFGSTLLRTCWYNVNLKRHPDCDMFVSH